jgi:hypothetical protein
MITSIMPSIDANLSLSNTTTNHSKDPSFSYHDKGGKGGKDGGEMTVKGSKTSPLLNKSQYGTSIKILIPIKSPFFFSPQKKKNLTIFIYLFIYLNFFFFNFLIYPYSDNG